jgi:hypothetical protein
MDQEQEGGPVLERDQKSWTIEVVAVVVTCVGGDEGTMVKGQWRMVMLPGKPVPQRDWHSGLAAGRCSRWQVEGVAEDQER